MKYNFDEVIDRRGTDSEKVEGVKVHWGREDLIPMWVADMDFRTPPFVIDAIKRRLSHEILGYTCKPECWYTAIVNWAKQRYQWDVTKDMINFSPGIIPGFTAAIQKFTKPGEKVLVQSPVYHPFFLMSERNNREVVYNQLKFENGRYYMDMELFKEQIKECKLFILCNPQNPSGRVWSKDELKEIARICHENKVLVVSDEIHADLTFPQYQHHPFASVSEEARMNSIVLMSPSKAFNMPGICSAYSIIPDEEIRRQFTEQMVANAMTEGHVFAYTTVAAAYSNGTEWLNQMLEYIQGNIKYLDDFLKQYIPEIKAIPQEATYLVFLDCKGLGLSLSQLKSFFEDGAHIAVNNGVMFGKGGEGCMRINIACPRSTLQKALNQLKEAYDNLK